jgi:phosphatidylglycerol:prolipoprotein diacylglycerol transferase
MEIPGITFPLLGSFELDFLPYFTVFGWKIYWYGVIIAVGFLLAVVYGLNRAPSLGLTEDDVIDALLWAVPLGIIGARLYYVIFYRDGNGANPYFDGQNDFREIIAIWEGGLAIYGGVLGGALGLLISTKRKKISTRAMFDDFACGLLIGQAVGRWGNFTNREAYGAQTTVPWRMGLVYSYKTFYYHPTFLYESLWNVLGLILIHSWSKKHRKYDGQMFLAYLAWYGLGRIVIEGLRTDSLYLGSTNLRVSQLLAGLTCVLSLAAMFFIRFFRNPEPGELWLNRQRSAVTPAPGSAPEPEEEAPMPAADIDEELREAFRLLSREDDSPAFAPEGEPEAPETGAVLREPEGIRLPGEAEERLPETGPAEETTDEIPPPETGAGTEIREHDTAEAAQEAPSRRDGKD